MIWPGEIKDARMKIFFENLISKHSLNINFLYELLMSFRSKYKGGVTLTIFWWVFFKF